MIGVALLLSSISYAKESGYSLSAALVGMSMDYREYGVTDNSGYGVYDAPKSMDTILDSEKSTLDGIVGGDFSFAYCEVLESQNYMILSINMMIVGGETEYLGSYIGSTGGYGSVANTTKDIITDTSIEYSYTQVFDSKIELSYGVGLGYRLWRRELSSSQVEDYAWYSIRPMLGIGYSFSKFSIGSRIEYQYAISPKMTLLQNSQHSDISVNLGAANILQVAIPFKYELDDTIDLFVEYTYENQIIDKSDRATLNNSYIWEPRSEANNQYLKIGATLKF